MDDIDLFNLSQFIPSNSPFPYLPKVKKKKPSFPLLKKPLPKDSFDISCFGFHMRLCLETFTKEKADEFTTYMQDRPVAEAVKTLYEKMLDYCTWFKSLPSEIYIFGLIPVPLVDVKNPIRYRDCVKLYYTFCRWRDIIAKYMPSIVETTTGSTEEGKQPDTTEEAKQPDSEPNNMAASTSKKSGRQSKPFETIISGDKERMGKVLTGLHALIGDKSGKDALIYIAVAFDMGVFSSRPTYTQVTDEFGYLGNRSTFGNWIELCSTAKNGKQISTYNEGEITAAKQALERALNQD